MKLSMQALIYIPADKILMKNVIRCCRTLRMSDAVVWIWPGPIVEEPSDDEPTSSATSAGAGPSGALGMPPDFPADSEAVQRSLAMMKDMDPEALKSMHKMMADLSPEVIASMTPGVTPEMARQTQEKLKSISPEVRSPLQDLDDLLQHTARNPLEYLCWY
jgi:hypothetical protein